VIPITGKPGKPTTQGKQERLHQTVHRFLDAHQPIANRARLDELLAEFEEYYNKFRTHQAHSPRRTPDEVYEATPKACPPSPPTRDEPQQTRLTRDPRTSPRPAVGVERISGADSRIHVGGCCVYLGADHRRQHVYAIYDDDTIMIFDTGTGEMIGETIRPLPKNGKTPLVTLRPRDYRDRQRRTETVHKDSTET
jgi:hypothetical protein